MRNLLSAILIIDELPHLDFVPWREAVASVLRFVDELVVVHGGKAPASGQRSALDYFASLNDKRIKSFILPWAEEADWTQIGRSCAFGQLQASGEWVFRVLIDEVFPEEFTSIRGTLAQLPEAVALLSVQRYYLLGVRNAFPYRQKPLFVRQGRGFTYGLINPRQGPQAMPLLFDDPIDARRWHDGVRVVEREAPAWIELPGADRRLRAGETPAGYRDQSGERETALAIGFLNTDVNYLPDELIVRQKWNSALGYARLPEGYRRVPDFTPETALQQVERKIRRMAGSGQLVSVTVPEELLAFADRQNHIHNVVRRICEVEYNLPWNRVATERRGS